MKGERLLAVLKFIGDGVVKFADLQQAIINAGYGASGKRIDFEFSKIQKTRRISRKNNQEKKRLSSLLYKMRRDGLLDKDLDSDAISLTAKGWDKYMKLNDCACGCLPRASGYRVVSAGVLKVVVFDVPEIQKRKREWLVSVLKNLGFKMLQESVWVGKRKLPPEFIKDVYRLGIIDCLEVFEVIKMGSLREKLKSDLD